MSLLALEALRATDLLTSENKVGPLSKMGEAHLQKCLDYYYKIRIQHIQKELSNTLADKQDMAAVVSSISSSNDVESLLPTTLTYNRIYVNDPLMPLARPQSIGTEAFNKQLGLKAEKNINLHRLANKLLYFEKLAPLIELKCLYIIPIEDIRTPPRTEIPINFSEDWFRSQVPTHIHDHIHKNAQITEVKASPDGEGLIMLDTPPSNPTRGIAIDFRGDSPECRGNFYLLYEQKFLGKAGPDTYRISQKLDWNNPPTKEMYEAWVYQSVNKTIIRRLEWVSRELDLSNSLRASYLTESKFESDICGMSADTASPKNQVNAVNFLKVNAPKLKIATPDIIARLRVDHNDLFERWQLALLTITEKIDGNDPNFDRYAKQLFESEVQPQLDALNEAALKMTSNIAGSTLLTASTIGLAILATPALPFAAVLGLGALGTGGQALPSVTEYLSKRRGPAFVWKHLAK